MAEKRGQKHSVPAFKARQQRHTVLEIVPQIASGPNGVAISSSRPFGGIGICRAEQHLDNGWSRTAIGLVLV
jgi:hypothetical protein